MFWLGDSAWGWRYNGPKIPKEILQGINDNIPLCCVLYYTFVKVVCLLTKMDKLMFTMFFRPDRVTSTYLYSEDFRELQYWRCPLCKLIGKKTKLKWNGLKWE